MKDWNELKFWKSEVYEELQHRITQESYLSQIFPQRSDWFRAMEATPFDKVKVVILGQDPYPTEGHAHGLAFSVLPSVKPIPPSLRNIFTEYQEDLGYKKPSHGCLLTWASNGVLLWNTIPTVKEGKPGSCRGWGWEKLTIEVMYSLSLKSKRRLVFLLWGKAAQEYKGLINNKHLIIEASHPSPYSANVSFLGHKPFSRTNEFLKKHEQETVEWRL